MSIVCDWMPNKLNIPQVLSLVNELVPSLVMPGPISGFREIFRQNKYLDLPHQTPDHREEIPPVPKQRLLGKLVGEAVAPLKRLDVIYRTFCGRLQRMSPRSKYHWTLAWIFFCLLFKDPPLNSWILPCVDRETVDVICTLTARFFSCLPPGETHILPTGRGKSQNWSIWCWRYTLQRTGRLLLKRVGGLSHTRGQIPEFKWSKKVSAMKWQTIYKLPRKRSQWIAMRKTILWNISVNVVVGNFSNSIRGRWIN